MDLLYSLICPIQSVMPELGFLLHFHTLFEMKVFLKNSRFDVLTNKLSEILYLELQSNYNIEYFDPCSYVLDSTDSQLSNE